MKKIIALLMATLMIIGTSVSTFAFSTNSHIEIHATCSNHVGKSKVYTGDYYAATNATSHRLYKPYMLFCNNCGGYVSSGTETGAESSHSRVIIGDRHVGTTHKISESCEVCSYSFGEKTYPCSGNPCITPYSVTPIAY